jgi:hypothetical protein
MRKLNNRGKFALGIMLLLIISIILYWIFCCKPQIKNEIIKIHDLIQVNGSDKFLSFTLKRTDSTGNELEIAESESENYIEYFEVYGDKEKIQDWNKIYLCQSDTFFPIKFYFKNVSINQRKDTIIYVDKFVLIGEKSPKAKCITKRTVLGSTEIVLSEEKCYLNIKISNKDYRKNELYYSITGPNGPWVKGKTKWKIDSSLIGKNYNVWVSTNEDHNNPISAYQNDNGDEMLGTGCNLISDPVKEKTIRKFEKIFNAFGRDVNNKKELPNIFNFLKINKMNKISTYYNGQLITDLNGLSTILGNETVSEQTIKFKAANINWDCENGIMSFEIEKFK